MDDHLSPLWTHLTSAGRRTGTWRSALPVWENAPSPCLAACPVEGRIAEWIGQLREGDLRGAWETLCDNNPFPAVAGRICHHPCEGACNRNELDETVGICALERFVGDAALAEGWAFPPPAQERDLSVAVVGGGPAGLSAAYQLRRRGIRVVLYERSRALGGLMRHAIPPYRLERAVLEAEIARILALGIEVKLDSEVTDAAALADLRGRHDALFLAAGAGLPRRLPGLDDDAPWVVDSAAFLAAPPELQSERAGAHVVVVGGGSAAMDVARTLRRLGREVTVLALESEGQLPAQPVELAQAREEGVRFETGARLVHATPGPGGLGLECERVTFRPGDRPGSFRAEPVPGSAFRLRADTIIPAIGQEADLERWGTMLGARGGVIAAGPGGRTRVDGIHAGGDIASHDRFVTAAIGMGKRAAQAIAAELEIAPAEVRTAASEPVGFDRINTAHHERLARQRAAELPVPERLSGFALVQQALDADAARNEARRCFSCGTCIFCDNCHFYCPDMAVARLEGGYAVNTDYCKGCGLCVAECPTGAVLMREEKTP